MLFILAQIDKYNKCQIFLFRRAGRGSIFARELSAKPRLLCPRKIAAGRIISGFAFWICVSGSAK